jgi:hypothetical protein
MTDMSKAIRHVIEDHATNHELLLPALKRVPIGALEEMTTILEAFYLDLKGELERRRSFDE